MDKIKNISLLLFAGGQYRPDAFAPTHANLAPGSLRYPPVNYHTSNLPLSTIVGRLNSRLGQKTKIIFRRLAPKPSGQFFGQWMVWRPSHPAQKAIFDFSHQTKETSGSQLVTAMQCIKQLFEPSEQFICPKGQLFNSVLSKKANLANKMSHAILYWHIKQPGVFTIRPPIVRTDNTGKVFAQRFFKYIAAARIIDLKQTVIRCIKTPRPVQLSVIMMAGSSTPTCGSYGRRWANCS
jgi:hypothetical protein